MRLGSVTATMMFAVCLAGCAGVSVKTIGTSDELDEKVRGYRYYQGSSYLLVYTDNKGGLTSQILYLMDPSKKMSARPFAVAANNNSTLTFESGVLKQAVIDVDETVVPKAALDALKDVLTSAVKSAGAFNIPVGEQTMAPAPTIFKIVVHGGHIMLIGGGTTPPAINTSIVVPVPKGKAPDSTSPRSPR
jgi:hypothetical protein